MLKQKCFLQNFTIICSIVFWGLGCAPEVKDKNEQNLQQVSNTPNGNTPRKTIEKLPFNLIKVTLEPLSPTNNSNNINVSVPAQADETIISSTDNSLVNNQSNTNISSQPFVDTSKNTVDTSKKIVESNPAPKVDKEVTNVNDLPAEINNIVLLKKGSYYIDRTIKINPGGKLIIEKGTKIEMDTSGIMCLGKLVAKGTKSEPISIGGSAWDNVTISGKESDAYLEFCQISGGSGIGVSTDGDEYVISPQSVMTTFGSGVLFLNAKGEVTNCEFSNSYGTSMVGIFSSDVKMKSSKISDYNELGIAIWNGKVLLDNNEFRDLPKLAVSSNGKSDINITNNQFLKCQTCIVIQDKSKSKIANNTFRQSFAGIVSGFESEIAVSDNKFVDMTGIAIASQHNAKVKATNNEINIAVVGMKFTEKVNINITNNKFDSVQTCIITQKSVTKDIKDNQFVNCLTKEKEL